jgi:Ca2+-binding EF-hand superfamily protein
MSSKYKYSNSHDLPLRINKEKEIRLSHEEIIRIYKIFKIICEGEKEVECVRQVLSEVSKFDPFATFKFLDSDKKNFLNKNDIQNYLK